MAGYRGSIDDVKTLIELAVNVEQADGYIEEFTEYKTTREKLMFVLKLYDLDVTRLGEYDSDKDAGQMLSDYKAVLGMAIKRKWDNYTVSLPSRSASSAAKETSSAAPVADKRKKGSALGVYIISALLLVLIFVFFRKTSWYYPLIAAVFLFAGGFLLGKLSSKK